jgi:hypothetical protein
VAFSYPALTVLRSSYVVTKSGWTDSTIRIMHSIMNRRSEIPLRSIRLILARRMNGFVLPGRFCAVEVLRISGILINWRFGRDSLILSTMLVAVRKLPRLLESSDLFPDSSIETCTFFLSLLTLPMALLQ